MTIGRLIDINLLGSDVKVKNYLQTVIAYLVNDSRSGVTAKSEQSCRSYQKTQYIKKRAPEFTRGLAAVSRMLRNYLSNIFSNNLFTLTHSSSTML